MILCLRDAGFLKTVFPDNVARQCFGTAFKDGVSRQCLKIMFKTLFQISIKIQCFNTMFSIHCLMTLMLNRVLVNN